MSAVPAESPKKKRHVFRWVFLGIQVLFLAWIIGGVTSSGGGDCPGGNTEACAAGEAIGTGIGVALIIGLWLAVDAILAVTYLIFRKR